MNAKIREQIMAIRDSGEVNMLDASMVQQISDVRGYLELSVFLQGHRREYTRFILTGEEGDDSGKA